MANQSDRALAIQTLRGSRAALVAALPIIKRVALVGDARSKREAEMTAAWIEAQVQNIDEALPRLTKTGSAS